MTTATPNRFVAWLKRVEDRADAWAGTCLTPEEFADAKALDVQLKRNFWRWLGIYLVAAAAVTVLLQMIVPKLGWTRSVLIANVACVCLIMMFVSAWYRHSKYVGRHARKTFALMIGGACAGGFGAWLQLRGPISEMTDEGKIRMLGIIAAGLVIVFGVLSGIAYLRSREVRQRLVLTQADADRERLARQGVQAELKMLQAQVEPHFLFNTLANLRYLVQSDPPQAVVMLDHLIHYLRTALPEIRAESSTVGREIELARSYLEILRIRMGGALEISTTTPPDVADLPFPPLVLLTLVENAIKHGIAPLGTGHVRVSAATVGRRLQLVVEDDGRGLAPPIGHGVGLNNVRERLRAIFGEGASLTLASGQGGGAVATIEVPL